MKKIKLNSAVSYYEKPVYSQKNPVMALSVMKKKIRGKYQGVIREIISRKGDVEIPGFVDRSKLFLVESDNLIRWRKKKTLDIKRIDKIVKKYCKKNWEFIGLEDPDIFIEENKVHLFFTIAYRLGPDRYAVFLGHAMGDSLDNLIAKNPVLGPQEENLMECSGFKEVSLSPVKHNNFKINLAESGYFHKEQKKEISTIASSRAKTLGGRWEFLETVFDPIERGIDWVGEHASPGPILNPEMIKHGKNLVGFVNGRSPSHIDKNGKRIYGKFRVGLMLVNSKTGKIPWVSPEYLIEDPSAKTITFASDFIPTENGKGILYAHVDDRFVRAYEIDLKKLLAYLPEKYKL